MTKIYSLWLEDWTTKEKARLLWWSMGWSLAPDIDVLYYCWLLYKGLPKRHHHEYFPHWPFTWIFLFGVCILLNHVLIKNPKYNIFAWFMLLQTMFHISLDFFTSKIYWLMPFQTTKFVEIFTVTENCFTNPKSWCHQVGLWENVIPCSSGQSLQFVRSMICYPTFLLEVVICMVAVITFLCFRFLPIKK